jgi:hypothetical protein
LEYFREKARRVFTDAAQVGNYLTGVTVSAKVEGTIILILTDDHQHIKSLETSRQSLKLKFVRVPALHSKADCTNNSCGYGSSFRKVPIGDSICTNNFEKDELPCSDSKDLTETSISRCG